MERTVWTSGLVRWRLKLAGETLRRMPSVSRYGVRSSMPEIVREPWKDAPPAALRPRPAAARSEEITLLDVAYDAVMAATRDDPADRIVLLGVMVGLDSVQLLEHERLGRLPSDVRLPSERTIRRRAHDLCELIAKGWNAAGYPVDGATLARQQSEEARSARYSRSLERNRHGVLAVMQSVAGAEWDGVREAVQK